MLIWLAAPVLAFYGITAGLFALLMVSDGAANSYVTWEFEASSDLPVSATALPMLTWLCFVCCSGAYGVLRERIWARPVIAYGLLTFNLAAIAVIFMLSDSVRRGLARADWGSAACAALVYLYLYHYPAAVRYYQRLAGQPARNSATAS